MRRIRNIARAKQAEFKLVEGAKHTKVEFDGEFVTTVPRHTEINELTARGILRDAEQWRPGPTLRRE